MRLSLSIEATVLPLNQNYTDMTPEKATYLTLKDLFNKTKLIIKEENMRDCKLIFHDQFHNDPHFALIYTKPAPTPDSPNMQIRDETLLMKLFEDHGIEFKYELQMMELVLNHQIVDNISMKSSWKNFINDNFHNCADLIQEYQKEEVEKFNNKLDKNLKPKNEPVKKMKI